jgi:serine/threonine protein kinase/tetratricopeptide (TPR) repeat protein
MEPQPQSVKQVFDRALEIDSRTDREAFLAQACAGSPQLRQRVEVLLRAYESSGDFLEPPATDSSADLEPAGQTHEGPGAVIGPYRLLQQLGEGGMGTVFMAEQTEPVQRKVALKIIKPGMDSRQVIARFAAEQHALAMMDHPNIARVLDAGTTASGRPYFVMELVKGIPITEYCDEHQLTPRQRLELFVPVCQAVQHAHQKGIVHRDLKPSNVLIARYDERAIAKVIDFGVAKAVGPRLTDKTLFTEFGQMLGTVEYMSPEQAGLNQLDIDTRSDIYSLGVLLYELLTGSTPLESQRVKKAAILEVLRLVREEEVPKPSTRLSSTDQLPSISAKRGLEPKKLSLLVRGDLDWIVMKALEKDRGRRYETANGLAADVQRYLNDEPVQACPPSVGYRFHKFARRNRRGLVAAAVMLIVLVLATVISIWQAVVATRANRSAIIAAAAEKRAKESAEAQVAETRAVLDFVEKNVFAAARPEGQAGGLGRDVTLRQAIESALLRIDAGLRDKPVIEARLRMTVGTSFRYGGEPQKAEKQLLRARELFTAELGPDHPDTLTSAQNLANCYGDLGRHDQAMTLHAETLERRKATLGRDHRDTLKSMDNFAICYYFLGRYPEAAKLHEEALNLRRAKLGPDHLDTISSVNNLASDYEAIGQREEALKLREESFHLIRARLGPAHPDTLACMTNLSVSYSSLGRHVEALKLREEALDLLKRTLGLDHPHTLVAMNNLASTYEFLGRHAETLKLREETLQLRTTKLGADHPDTILSMANLAFSLVELKRDDEAVRAIDECVKRSAGKTVDPRVVPGIMDLRLRIFEKKADIAGCLETADRWEALKRPDPDSLSQAACFRAVCAAVISEKDRTPGGETKAKEQADRAMIWLKQAVAAGYKNSQLAKNADLDALRDRDDFKKLMLDQP